VAPTFSIRTRDPGSRARTGTLHLHRGEVRTPAFVPLATKAVVKTLEVGEAGELGYDMVLSNTFHLFLAPGPELIERFGGVHRFMRWDKPVITDSGGFQVFSMGHGTVADEIKGRATAAQRSDRAGAILGIDEDGVRFRSYVDGAEKFLGPETSMAVQAALGSDIALVFDECLPFHVTREYTQRSTERTHRCPECGLTIDRDLNAALNVLNRAGAGPGLHNADVASRRAGVSLGRTCRDAPKAAYPGSRR